MDDASNEWIKSIMRRLDSMVRWRGRCVAYIGQELRAFEQYLTLSGFCFYCVATTQCDLLGPNQ